jgi:glycosyltransferase involved in cell wall biosynthesis
LVVSALHGSRISCRVPVHPAEDGGRGVTRVAFVSVVPSPYQRDIFAALAARDDVAPRVYYMNRALPESPWPERPLATYESYLPGFWFPIGSARINLNWRLPSPRDFDVIVCNTLMSLTAQWLMRGKLRHSHRGRWIFWGEKLGARSRRHDFLTAPLHRASGIAAIGSWAERDYAARFPHTRVFNIPYHCELAPFAAEPRPPREPGIVTYLFCGQMIARKGVDHLLAAFATLPENARLLLVGREAELPELLGRLTGPVRARIHYAGFQAPEALPPFFARADVFVLPSRYDGWGVVVNQALGAGLPIVVSDQVGAAHDLVREGENGFIFRAGDADALAAALLRYSANPALARTHGEASRLASADWTPARGAERWARALQSVCS